MVELHVRAGRVAPEDGGRLPARAAGTASVGAPGGAATGAGRAARLPVHRQRLDLAPGGVEHLRAPGTLGAPRQLTGLIALAQHGRTWSVAVLHGWLAHSGGWKTMKRRAWHADRKKSRAPP